jgi:coenzyme F420-reducing hydrogenase alpha subunit
MSKRSLRVAYLARVEGEGALDIQVHDGRVTKAHLSIFEPPRFFEALLRGRRYDEAPDITARICGICPVAYQMSAVHAVEDAFGVAVPEPLRLLRRLIYCGEWIESHALHIYMLHAPDFLGFEDAIQMARAHPDVVQQGLELKKIGNELVALLGGREIHPVNVKVGGFYRIPAPSELAALADRLKRARDAALRTVSFSAGLDFPDFEQDYEFVALRHATEYPFNEGRLVSNRGLDIPVREYNRHFEEDHVAHSTALHARLSERGAYAVGPLARYALNFDHLGPTAQEAARAAGLGPVCRNPFKSIVVRGVETVFACEEALRIIEHYEPPSDAAVHVKPIAASGYACTEAPRGVLYHRYRFDGQGIIRDARIVPPTSQNQATIEADLRAIAGAHLNLPDLQLTRLCEQAIRNYDPCISCSVHFLRLNVEGV